MFPTSCSVVHLYTHVVCSVELNAVWVILEWNSIDHAGGAIGTRCQYILGSLSIKPVHRSYLLLDVVTAVFIVFVACFGLVLRLI